MSQNDSFSRTKSRNLFFLNRNRETDLDVYICDDVISCVTYLLCRMTLNFWWEIKNVEHANNSKIYCGINCSSNQIYRVFMSNRHLIKNYVMRGLSLSLKTLNYCEGLLTKIFQGLHRFFRGELRSNKQVTCTLSTVKRLNLFGVSKKDMSFSHIMFLIKSAPIWTTPNPPFSWYSTIIQVYMNLIFLNTNSRLLLWINSHPQNINNHAVYLSFK